MKFNVFLPYLLVMAIVTYLVRVIPLVLVKGKIRSRFLQSFLFYVPYTVLSAMTFPAILYATDYMISAVAALIVAVALSVRKRGLIEVAVGACSAVLIVELMIKLL